jgi:hypothetical protein
MHTGRKETSTGHAASRDFHKQKKKKKWRTIYQDVGMIIIIFSSLKISKREEFSGTDRFLTCASTSSTE